MEKVRVLLADSHPQVRAQLAARLKREPGIELIGQSSSSGQTLRIALSNPPDILLIDPMMKDGFGIANLRQIVSRLPGTVVIILTAYVDTALKMEFNRMGIVHILMKGLSSDNLIQLIRSIGDLTQLSVS